MGWASKLALAIALGFVSIAAADPLPYRSLTDDFADFANSTIDKPMADRVRAFREVFGRKFPAFYRPRDGRSVAQYDLIVAQALRSFPAHEAGYDAVVREFPTTFATELAHFRETFTGFTLDGPVYLLHSLGEMDGGTRIVGGRRVLIFAADGIATLDTPDSVPMLLDHEFFHMAHARSFPGCFALWCTLWREGMATYAAGALHPGATDKQIALEAPVPLRPAVDAHWREAVCLVQAKLDKAGSGPDRLFFLADGGTRNLPPRFGYYLGYRIVQRVATGRSLAVLMALPMSAVHPMLREHVAAMAAEAGGCSAPTFAAFVTHELARPPLPASAPHPQ